MLHFMRSGRLTLSTVDSENHTGAAMAGWQGCSLFAVDPYRLCVVYRYGVCREVVGHIRSDGHVARVEATILKAAWASE